MGLPVVRIPRQASLSIEVVMLSIRPRPIEKESSGVTYYDSAVNENRDAQSSNAHDDSESYVEVSVLPSSHDSLICQQESQLSSRKPMDAVVTMAPLRFLPERP